MPLPVYRFGTGDELYTYQNGQYVHIRPEQMSALWNQYGGLEEVKVPGALPSQSAGMGVQPGGFVPTEALDSLYPYLTFQGNQALALAQLQNQRDIAERNAWASVFGDQIRAGATVQAAAAAADAQIQSQKIQTGGQMAIAQGQLGLQAGTANQATAMQLAQMAGSGQLRDAIANRLALRGFGNMPGIGSALNGVQNRIWVTAPNIGSVPGGGSSGGNYSQMSGGGSFGGGSFSGGMSGGNMADIYNRIYQGIQPSLIGGNVFGYGGKTTSSVPLGFGGPPLQGTPEQIAQLSKAADGGTFGPGASVLVGERGPEVMTVGSNQVQITPLVGAAATGGTYALPSSDKEGLYPAVSPSQPSGTAQPGEGWVSPAATTFSVAGRATSTPRTSGGLQFGGDWWETLKQKFGNLAGPGLTPNRPRTQPVGDITPVGGGPLSDVNQIPALMQLRSGSALPAFGIGPTSFSERGLGVTNTPAPYLAASTFGRMSPYEQEDALQMYEFLGVPRQVAAYQIAEATPGYRRNPRMAFGI